MTELSVTCPSTKGTMIARDLGLKTIECEIGTLKKHLACRPRSSKCFRCCRLLDSTQQEGHPQISTDVVLAEVGNLTNTTSAPNIW